MMKFFKPAAFALTLLILGNASLVKAQDTTKRTKPAAVKTTVVKPQAKYPAVNKPAATPYKAPATPAKQTPGGAVLPVAVRPQPTTAENPALLTDKTLNGQYQYLLTKIYNYQRPLVSALWKNVNDTLNVTRRKFKESSAQLATQAKKIDSLQADVKTKDQTLNASNARMDEVMLLGIPMKKATYNWIMWGLVVVFGIVAAVVVARSGGYSREAKYRIKLYNDLEEEYKNYKAKANEKEKKLARELQTERNKLDELMNGGSQS